MGNSFHYLYDEVGELIEVTDDTGERFLHFSYDEQGRILEVTDNTARRISFSYDHKGDLVSMQDVLGETWSYEYEDAHRLVQMSDPHAVNQLRLVYDDQGRVIEQFDGTDAKTLAVSYGEDGATTLTNALGEVTQHVYDPQNSVLLRVIDSEGGVTERSYDANFRIASLTDPLGRVSYMQWSDDGHNLEHTIDAAGYQTTMNYNTANRLEQIIDPLTHSTQFNYDGPLLQNNIDALGFSTTYSYTTEIDNPQPIGLLKSISDPDLNTTEFVYNDYGDRVEVIDALSHAWSYQFNALGWLTEARNPHGVVTIYVYDNAGRIVEVMENYVEGMAIAEEGEYNILTQYAYDAVGNLELLIDTYGKVTFFEYDDAN